MLSEKEPIICNHTALYFRASVYMARFDEKRRLDFLDLIKKDICREKSTNINKPAQRLSDPISTFDPAFCQKLKRCANIQKYVHFDDFSFAWILYNAES